MEEPLLLVHPGPEHKEQLMAYKQAFFDAGEPVIHGSGLLDQMEDYEEWLQLNENNRHKETVADTWVLSDQLIALRKEDGKVVGMLSLRYELNDFLKDFGHCGYSVHPEERRKGYASRMLAMACDLAKEKGLDHLQLSASRDNEGSIRTILINGGTAVRSFDHDGKPADVYLISLEK